MRKNLNSIFSTIMGAGLGVFIQHLATGGELISSVSGLSVLIIIVCAFLVGLITRTEPRVRLEVQQLTEGAGQRYAARKGIILTYPSFQVYRHPDGYAGDNDNRKRELIEAMNREDFNAVDEFAGTSFEQIIDCMKAHRGRLEHVWIIWTFKPDDINRKFLDFSIKYINNRILAGRNTQFHVSNRYRVEPSNDWSNVKQAYEISRGIMKNCRQYGLKNKDIICFISPGIRSIGLGMTFASLHSSRDIQIASTYYTPEGHRNTDQKSTQTLIGFKTFFIGED